MKPFARFIALASLACAGLGLQSAQAQTDVNLLPKYGAVPKTQAQKAADREFIAGMDKQFKGDRKKAAQEAATRGWQSLRRGNPQEAMRRFNQAWLLDNANGSALWGMAAVQGGTGKGADALKLLQEAEKSLAGDLDFAVDHARALGMAGIQLKDEAMVRQALDRFARIHEQAPQHTLNLQNWAITLFGVGQFALAWSRIELAEATPRRAELDPRFIAALQQKMPRPKAK
jgi:tetratricopeptide (TPR) repeat protein